MDVFNALWDSPQQRQRPSNDDFQMFSAEDWITHSSTYRILSGTFTCPLPHEVEREQNSSKAKGWVPKSGVPSGVPLKNIHKTNYDPAKSQQQRVYIPGLLKMPSLPCTSQLSQEEQHDCFTLFQKFDGRSLTELTAQERAEYQLFLSLYKRVKEEQKQYMDIAKSLWPDYVSRAFVLKKTLQNFVDELYKVQVRSILPRYPTNFCKLKLFSLSYKDSPPVKVAFTRNLLNIGRIPLIKLPELNLPFRVATASGTLRSWKLLNINNKLTNGSLHRVPVSADPNAERLARLNKAQVVISSAGLKSLLDVHPTLQGTHPPALSRFRKLPVVVKQYRSFENGRPTNRNIVFIDKALPAENMTGYEKVLKYHKHALLAAVVHQFSEAGKNFDIIGEDFEYHKGDNSEQLAPSATCTASELKDLPVASSCSSQNGVIVSDSPHNLLINIKKGPKQCELSPLPLAEPARPNVLPESPNLNCCFDADSDDEEKLVMDVDEEHREESIVVSDDTFGTFDNVPYSSPRRSTTFPKGNQELSNCDQVKILTRSKVTQLENNDTHLDLNLKTATHRDSLAVFPMCENIKTNQSNQYNTHPVKLVNGNALPLKVTNLVYNLWTVHEESSSNNSINFLVRNRVRGCESIGGGKYQDLCVASKPEFQLEFGAEAVSLSEISRQWTDLFFHPGAELARVRVNAASSEMVKVERRSTCELENEANQLHGVDVSETLPVLYKVFSELQDLPCGQYMLSFNPDLGNDAEIFKEMSLDEKKGVDLTLRYERLEINKSCVVPWLPLDPTVILPKNTFFKTLPCTFMGKQNVKTHPKNKAIMKPNQNVMSQNKNKNKKKNKGSLFVTDSVPVDTGNKSESEVPSV